MHEPIREGLWGVAAAALGAAAGAVFYGTFGAVGMIVAGATIGLTLAPVAMTGAGLALAAYGLFCLGKRAGAARGARHDARSGESGAEG